MRGALNGLRLTNVHEASSEAVKGLGFDKDQFVAKVKDGSVYHIDTATSGSSYYIQLNATYGKMIITAQDQASTQALALATTLADTAKGAVPGFNERHGKWVYEVSSYYHNRFTKQRSGMIEPVPDPNAPKAGAPSPGGFQPGGANPNFDIQKLLQQQQQQQQLAPR